MLTFEGGETQGTGAITEKLVVMRPKTMLLKTDSYLHRVFRSSRCSTRSSLSMLSQQPLTAPFWCWSAAT